MREIKFRAWTKRDKCWCGAFAIHKDGFFSESPNNPWTDLSKQDEIVLEQFTGLKDKNGVKIFEGDRLKVSGHCYEDCFEDNVIFMYGMFCFDGRRYGLDNYKEYMFEVIGNIHEGEVVK